MDTKAQREKTASEKKKKHKGSRRKKTPHLSMLMLLSHCWVLSEQQSSPDRADKQLPSARRLITTGRWDKPVEQLKCQQKVTQPKNHSTSGFPRTTWNNCRDGFLREQPLGAAQELYLTCLWGGENGNQKGDRHIPLPWGAWHLAHDHPECREVLLEKNTFWE